MRSKLSTMLACLAVVSCASAQDAPPRTHGVAPPARLPEGVVGGMQPAGTPVSTASMPRDLRRAVVADAARRFNVTENDVVLSDAQQITWSDGSLGCPEPGGVYTQALVPGYRVTASTQQGKLVYHTDAHGQVRNCAPARFQPGNKTLPGGQGSGAEPGTQPPVRGQPDR